MEENKPKEPIEKEVKKPDKPRVSVLLTAYNRPFFLKKAIDSVLDQDFQSLELILLDDNSDDKEHLKVLMEYWNHPKVILYKSNIQKEDRKKTVRYATLINEGFKISQGEFIAYLCDDDFWFPQKLTKMVEFLDANPDKSCVYGQQKQIYYNEAMELQPEKEMVRPAELILDNAAFNVDHSSVLHRRKVFEEAKGWDDDGKHWNSGDAAFFERVSALGYKWFPIKEVLDCHAYHHTSWTNDRWQNL